MMAQRTIPGKSCTKSASHEPRIRAFRQETNQGKGAALRRAITELQMPFALVQDADLEYDPRDYPTLLEPMLEGRADAVYWRPRLCRTNSLQLLVRDGKQSGHIGHQSSLRLLHIRHGDGYKVLRSDLWRRLCLKGTRFDIEPDITARILRLGYRIHEVPISYYARSRADGKKLTWRDGVRALGTLGRLRLTSDHSLFGTEVDQSTT